MAYNTIINPIAYTPSVFVPQYPVIQYPVQQLQQKKEQNTQTIKVATSPLLQKTIIAQNSKILSTNNIKNTQLTEAEKRVPGYKNDLRESLTGNQANIMAVIPRTMNAKDLNGDDLIRDNEVSGNFINATERLDEIKNLGFNTQHMLPINPPGKKGALGTAGSLYAPSDFLRLDPELVDENPPKEIWGKIAKLYKDKTGKELVKMDKNDPEVAFAQCKYYIDECHKKGIKVMLDLPSCASIDFIEAHPNMKEIGSDGKETIPQGWQDIRMLRVFDDKQKRILNKDVLDMHKKYVDMCIELGFDGIRADVGRAKPVGFWNVIIPYSRSKDPHFGWLAETYTHEDASPQANLPYDRPQELLEVGFDSYYGQYHIFYDWLKADDLYKYVKENIDMNNNMKQAKSLIGSFATHDDSSPMLYGGAPWIMFTTTLQSMLPQVNPYMVDGAQTGDYYLYKYGNAIANETATDNNICEVHTGRIDIFNKSRKPGGNSPEIANTIKAALSLRNGNYNEVNKQNPTRLKMANSKDVLNKGSFIILPSNNPEIIAFARHYEGKTLIFIGNRNVNENIGGTIQIPGLKSDEKFKNLMPKYGKDSKFQNNQNGTATVELSPNNACIFEINTPDIEELSEPQNVMQQKYVK